MLSQPYCLVVSQPTLHSLGILFNFFSKFLVIQNHSDVLSISYHDVSS